MPVRYTPDQRDPDMAQAPAPTTHSPAPFKLAVAGTTWGLAQKGASKQGGEADVAQGTTYTPAWRYDVALFRAAPAMLAALRLVGDNNIIEPEVRKAVAAAIRAATTPVKEA